MTQVLSHHVISERKLNLEFLLIIVIFHDNVMFRYVPLISFYSHALY